MNGSDSPSLKAFEEIDYQAFLRNILVDIEWSVVQNISTFADLNKFRLDNAKASDRPSYLLARNCLKGASPPPSLEARAFRILMDYGGRNAVEHFKAFLGPYSTAPTLEQLTDALLLVQEVASKAEIVFALAHVHVDRLPARDHAKVLLERFYGIAVPLKSKNDQPKSFSILSEKPKAKKKERSREKKPVKKSATGASPRSAKIRTAKSTSKAAIGGNTTAQRKAIAVTRLTQSQRGLYRPTLPGVEPSPQHIGYRALVDLLDVPYEVIFWIAQKMYFDAHYSSARQVRRVREFIAGTYRPVVYSRIILQPNISTFSISSLSQNLQISQTQCWLEVGKIQSIDLRDCVQTLLGTAEEIAYHSRALVTSDEAAEIAENVASAIQFEHLKRSNPKASNFDSLLGQNPLKNGLPRGSASHYHGNGRSKRSFKTLGEAERAAGLHRKERLTCRDCDNRKIHVYECQQVLDSNDRWFGRVHFHWGHGWPER